MIFMVSLFLDFHFANGDTIFCQIGIRLGDSEIEFQTGK